MIVRNVARGAACPCALALSLVVSLAGCVREPPGETAPRAKAGGVSLPSLDGLRVTKVGRADDGPPDARKWLKTITVDVPAEGAPRVAWTSEASRWRGVALPRDQGSGPAPRPLPGGLVVKVGDSGATSVSGIAIGNLDDLVSWVVSRSKGHPGRRPVALGPARAAPYGRV
ncbi:MAG: hypothetical protein ACYSU0_18725, partial [Planctomycetota bacterium]